MRINWSKWDHILGTMSDRDASKIIGCTQSIVAHRRTKIGRKPFFAPHPRTSAKQKQKIRELLSKGESVGSTARATGLGRWRVRFVRDNAGIAAIPRGDRAAKCRAAGLNPTTVHDRIKRGQSLEDALRPFPEGGPDNAPISWSSAMDSRLGTEPDSVLAVEFGCSKASIYNRRQWLNIRPYQERPKQHHLSPEVIARLGKESDSELGQKAGASRTTIRNARIKLGIPAFEATRKKQ